MSKAAERGAAAVEFAIVAPLLVTLLMGIAEFSRAFNVQASLAAAARESVRVMAVSNNQDSARTAAKNTAVSLQPALADTNIAFKNLDTGTTTCTSGSRMTVTITYTLSTLTGIAGPFTMTAKGAMLCGG